MKKPAVTFLGVGDVVIDLDQPETAFRHVADVLRSGDITYANCEQALSDKGSPNPRQAIHSEPRNIPAFLYAGFDIVSLANNHTQDWGKEALLDTMSRLKEAGLAYVGVDLGPILKYFSG
jgi:poly-gamma-glutamate capsule biosynthesis protein CapA/YwtB (metallophosphatase superfamily)